MRVALLCCLAVAATAAPMLEWPKQYTAEGTIYLPYAEITEPFVTMVDMTKKMSRVDTYGGTAVVLNRGDVGDYGTMFKTVPETTQSFANRMTCFKVPGVKEAPVTAQGMLPDLSLYNYVADHTIDDKAVMIFESHFSVGSKVNNYTLVVEKDTSAPLYLLFTGIDRLLGSHYDQYTIIYSNFKPSIDNQSVFSNPDNCISFPGPGNTVPMAENPMFEFIGSPGYTAAHQSSKIDTDFNNFKEKHGRAYATEKEEELRKFNFRHNHRYIHSTNRRNLSYKLGVNHLADLSSSERKRMRGYRHTKNSPRGEMYMMEEDAATVPTDYNWRLRGAVTPVKDQGICGSCWSFGTTGTIEGSYFLKHKQLKILSEQSLVDCSWGYGNNGCDGGESERAYQWIIDQGCIPTTDTYGPYTMQDGMCSVNDSSCGAKLSKFYNTPSGDENALMSAIYQKGPISVAIDASHDSFGFYSEGVYFEKDCGNGEDDLDHQVLAVGYGTLDGVSGQEYWLIKNSWSTHWGMDGYILMSRKDNNCGVATDASYADVL